jgi:acylphosphatase
MPNVRKRILVSGRVQGVAFRAYARKVARNAGAVGWVRNLSDGRVEAVVEGDSKIVDTVVDWFRKGSPYSRVENIRIFNETATGEFQDFDVAGGNWGL